MPTFSAPARILCKVKTSTEKMGNIKRRIRTEAYNILRVGWVPWALSVFTGSLVVYETRVWDIDQTLSRFPGLAIHWHHPVSTYWWQGWHPRLQLLLWLRTEVECSAVRGANLETVVESGQQCTTENKLIRTYTYTSISKSAQATVRFTHSP